MDFKALRKAELLGRGHHGPNDPRERGTRPRSHFAPAIRRNQRSDMLLRYSLTWGTSALRTSNQSSHHGNERAIKEDQALRVGLCKESYVPKLTDSQKENQLCD